VKCSFVNMLLGHTSNFQFVIFLVLDSQAETSLRGEVRQIVHG
jgi:hypothetical protein